MKKAIMLLLVLTLVFTMGSLALADENPAGSVSFDVTWQVDPMIIFAVGCDSNIAWFLNGELFFGDDEFSDYIFADRSPLSHGPGEVHGERVWANVFSNDWWKVNFIKPALVSDNDHSATAPVHAERYLYDALNNTSSYKTDFTGNDLVKNKEGIYLMEWDLWVEYEGWATRYGNYENTFEIICTQF